MKRIAAPMVGGMISSTVLTLVIIPAIYFLWRSRETEGEGDLPLPPTARRRPSWRAIIGAAGAILLAVGAWWLWPEQGGGHFSQSIQTETVGDYQFEIRGKKSELHVGQNPVEIRVTRGGAPAEVEKVSFELGMDLPGMPMRANGPLQKTAQPGVYRGSIKLDMQGEYNGQTSVIGPAGEARKNFTVRVAQ
jgi:hypothetical protein